MNRKTCIYGTPLSQVEDLIPEKSVLLMPIGYPADDSEPSERHTAKRDLSELVRYL